MCKSFGADQNINKPDLTNFPFKLDIERQQC